MKDEPANPGGPAAGAPRAQGLPAVVGRADFEAERAGSLAREKAQTAKATRSPQARRLQPSGTEAAAEPAR